MKSLNKPAVLVIILLGLLSVLTVRRVFSGEHSTANNETSTGEAVTNKVIKSDEEWRKLLTPEQYRVTRKHGTEAAFCGAFWDNHQEGVYRCVCCGNLLFTSDSKFESGTGWPSFQAEAVAGSIDQKRDVSLGMIRTEVLCSRCGAHLGHVFDDGPPPSGLRYCINSVALKFEPAGDKK